MFSVYVGFGVQGFVGDFLYVTCVSVRFKVEFISRLLVSFKSTGCYHTYDDNIQYSYLFNTMESDTEFYLSTKCGVSCYFSCVSELV